MDIELEGYLDFMEFEDVDLDAPFSEDEGDGNGLAATATLVDTNTDESTTNRPAQATHQSRNSDGHGSAATAPHANTSTEESTTKKAQATRKRRKKVSRGNQAAYSLQQAKEEKENLLKSAVNAIAKDEFVNGLANAAPIRDYVARVKTSLEDLQQDLQSALVKFSLLLVIVWPAIAASEKYPNNESLRRQTMYMKWHAIRCSEEFVDAVKDVFVTLVGAGDIPVVFIQMIGRNLFEGLMLKHEQVMAEIQQLEHPQLSIAEDNALRYVAGYIIFKLNRKIRRYANEEIIRKLIEKMTAGHDRNTKLDYSQEWVRKQNRGGLKLANDNTFMFFKKLERHVHCNLPNVTGKMRGCDIRQPMQESAMQDQELIKQWRLLHQGVVSGTASSDIFQCIVDFYIQIRGHSFAAVIVEKFKQSAKAHQKGSKGLRSGLKKKAAEKEVTKS